MRVSYGKGVRFRGCHIYIRYTCLTKMTPHILAYYIYYTYYTYYDVGKSLVLFIAFFCKANKMRDLETRLHSEDGNVEKM